MPFEPGNQLAKGPRKGNKLAGMAREKTDQALQVLVDALTDEKIENRIKAAQEILNRGWGKAPEHLTIGGDEENPVRQTITVELVRPDKNT